MRRLGLLVTGVLLLAGSTFAQDTSKGEVSGGWRYYHATITNSVRPFDLQQPNDFPMGWYADVALNLSPKFAIVGDASGAYFGDQVSRTITSTFTTDETFDFSFHVFMGGVRVRAPQRRAFVPFGQVLLGGQHIVSTDERTTTSSGRPSTSTSDGGTSGAVLALDAGVTITPGPIGIRASVGYVRFFSDANADAFRLSLGATYRF